MVKKSGFECYDPAENESSFTVNIALERPDRPSLDVASQPTADGLAEWLGNHNDSGAGFIFEPTRQRLTVVAHANPTEVASAG